MSFKQFCHWFGVFVQLNSLPITTQPCHNPGMLNLRRGGGHPEKHMKGIPFRNHPHPLPDDSTGKAWLQAHYDAHSVDSTISKKLVELGVFQFKGKQMRYENGAGMWSEWRKTGRPPSRLHISLFITTPTFRNLMTLTRSISLPPAFYHGSFYSPRSFAVF